MSVPSLSPPSFPSPPLPSPSPIHRDVVSRALPFLKAVEAKLLEVYHKSKYHVHSDTETPQSFVTFHIPAKDFDPELKESSLWKLGNIGLHAQEGVGDDLDRPEEVLLKTKPLMTPGINDEMAVKAWASADPSMKNVC